MKKIRGYLTRLRALLRFTVQGNGSAHRVGSLTRFRIGVRLLYAELKLRRSSASTFGEQLFIVNAIFGIPPSIQGAIAEFGCFKGASSIALSIAANFTQRKLIVFDSFEGLPEPLEAVTNIHNAKIIPYKKGTYKGTLEEVRANISRYGHISVVEFVKGYFNETLPKRPQDDAYCAIFEDADLVSSVKDVLVYGWPKLALGGIFLCHEARDLEVAQLFFDSQLWSSTLRFPVPGLIGAGFGVPVDSDAFQDSHQLAGVFNFGSCLAYTYKR